jgi:transcriptional regulator with XRE-family HTH domain
MAKGIQPEESMAALFGSRVRRLRTAAGLTQAELGARTHVVSTRITQIERSSGAKPTLELARALDAALGADNLLVDLWPYVYREAFPDWSRAFMAHSARAVSIGQYAAHVVPGLLQTEDYARAVLRLDALLNSEEQLEERVAARLGRQERLRSRDRPDLWVVLDEAVLRRPVGGRGTMQGQLTRLLEATAEPHITVQVLPFDQGEHEAMGGSLSVLTLPDSTEVAYTEGAEYGQLIEDPADVRRYAVIYDRLRAAALPPLMSLDMIRSVVEGNYRAANVPSRSERRRVAQQQLQQSGGGRLRGGGGRIPRPSCPSVTARPRTVPRWSSRQRAGPRS